jgi:hypothetical protein
MLFADCESGSGGRCGHIERAQALTDASSKGLFPQLTDVLCALSQSHAKLLSKVQSLRLEHTEATPSGLNLVEESAKNSLIGVSAVSRLPELVEAKASPVREASRTNSIDGPEPAELPIGFVGSEFDRPPEAMTKSDVEVQGADGRDTPLISTLSEGEPPPQQQMDAVVSTHTSPQPDRRDRREAAQSHPKRAESEGRNYNFFDELDDRLAGLGDQDQGPIAE